MRHILVTGGCGFIGSNFIRHELATYPELSILNIDKLTYAGNPKNLADLAGDSRYAFAHGDICDRKFLTSLLQPGGIDAVVNFAAESHVDRSILDSGPFVQTNIVGLTAAACMAYRVMCRSRQTRSTVHSATTACSRRRLHSLPTARTRPPKRRPTSSYEPTSTRSDFRP